MIINGTKTERVEVEVSDKEVIDAFLYLCGFRNLCDWTLKDNQLVKYEDVSIHGSPCWEEVARIKDPDTVRLYTLLKETLEILSKRKEAKQS